MRMIFVNLPVKDLEASRGFFGELGFEFNPQFSDDSAACMIVDENIFVMLLVEVRFRDFINDEIADATRTTEAITCLSAESREQIDETVAKAIAAGGKAVEAGHGRRPHVRRELPGSRRSRLGADAHGAALSRGASTWRELGPRERQGRGLGVEPGHARPPASGRAAAEMRSIATSRSPVRPSLPEAARRPSIG